MRKNNINWLRNITAACLALVIFTTSSMVALAGTENKSLMGEISVSGQNANGNAPFVLLNGEQALTGRTFFSNGTISTPESVTSTVNLGKLGYISLEPNTTLNLSFDENAISGTLSAGNINVFNADGVAVNIQSLNNATTSVVPMNNSRQDDDDNGNSPVGPIVVFAAIVTTAIVLVLLHNDDDDNAVVIPVSPVR